MTIIPADMEMRIPSIDRTMVVIYYKQKIKELCRLEIYYFYLKTFDFKLFVRKPIYLIST